jgi:hypothetical protein
VHLAEGDNIVVLEHAEDLHLPQGGLSHDLVICTGKGQRVRCRTRVFSPFGKVAPLSEPLCPLTRGVWIATFALLKLFNGHNLLVLLVAAFEHHGVST